MIDFDVKNTIEFIQSIGFPIFVAVYVLIRLEKAVNKVSESIERLIRELMKHNVRID